ncbi:MAG TPA: CBS domain-containing protein [Thermoplasmata archaeon]|nr:CBS domain-containing protein [Thermoplasmata archaeon]
MEYHDHRVGSLIVTDKDVSAGILTERDIIERIILAEKNPHETKVSEIMSRDLKTVHAFASVEQGANIMREHKIKKLTVLPDDKIVGILTVTDIANVMSHISRRSMMEALSSRCVNQTVKIRAIYEDKIKVFGKDEDEIHYIEDGEAALKVRIPGHVDTSTVIPEDYTTGLVFSGEVR